MTDKRDSAKIGDGSCRSDAADFLGCTLPPNPELIARGWRRRFIADQRMARDAVETYKELGYEVILEPVSVERLKDECSGCRAVLERFQALYTRR